MNNIFRGESLVISKGDVLCFKYKLEGSKPELGFVQFISRGHLGVSAQISMEITENGVTSSSMISGVGRPTRNYESYELNSCRIPVLRRNEDGFVYARVSLVPKEEVSEGIKWSFAELDELVR
jgi:hypothetical protein